MNHNGPFSNFLDGVEEELEANNELALWGPVLRPNEVPETAAPPPESFSQPVWSRSYGWIDRSELSYEPMVWVSPSEIE